MALPDARPSANTSVLHTYKDSKTDTCGWANHIRVWRPYRKDLSFCWPPHSANTRILKIQQTFSISSRRLNCLKIPSLSSWTSPASTKTYHRRRYYHCIVKHTKNFEEKPPIATRYLREMLSLILTRKIVPIQWKRSITSKLMEQPWVQKWP